MDARSLRLVVDFGVWLSPWFFRGIFGPFSLEKPAGKISQKNPRFSRELLDKSPLRKLLPWYMPKLGDRQPYPTTTKAFRSKRGIWEGGGVRIVSWRCSSWLLWGWCADCGVRKSRSDGPRIRITASQKSQNPNQVARKIHPNLGSGASTEKPPSNLPEST